MFKWKTFFLIELVLLIISSFLYFCLLFNLKMLEDHFLKFFIYCGVIMFFIINISFFVQKNFRFEKQNILLNFFKPLLVNYIQFYIKYYSDASLLNLFILRTIISIMAAYGSLSLFILDNIFNYSALFSLLPIYLCILLLIIPERFLLLIKIFHFLPIMKSKSTKLTERIYSNYSFFYKLDKYTMVFWIIGFILLAILMFILASLSKLFSLKIIFSLLFFITLEILIYPKIIKEANKILNFFNNF